MSRRDGYVFLTIKLRGGINLSIEFENQVFTRLYRCEYSGLFSSKFKKKHFKRICAFVKAGLQKPYRDGLEPDSMTSADNRYVQKPAYAGRMRYRMGIHTEAHACWLHYICYVMSNTSLL